MHQGISLKGLAAASGLEDATAAVILDIGFNPQAGQIRDVEKV